MASFGMKDVTNSKDFDVRRERSDTEEASKRISFVVKQAFKLVFSDTQLLFGILGVI